MRDAFYIRIPFWSKGSGENVFDIANLSDYNPLTICCGWSDYGA
jgi:hypothetical protein